MACGQPREILLGHGSPPVETGVLVFRATSSQKEIEALDDQKVEAGTLPYQGQGAAVAVESGAVLSMLLGLLFSEPLFKGKSTKLIPEVPSLYGKSRTTINVQGATANRFWQHP
ncbi:uncharacterized protein Z520_02830 [Fonsecaea multimorphosa CBS 102226]|uniref:Uncharacterized protein n=1 Tax=Fonsecaea multimorphosa CBS 102226 TaxID=1442371 RepID=A0A0D2K631_9EURO|nr:uncharacterized protein Z520_02830 [Fonsecaea multimorphosa CBS 102226]KIY01278.1 hypothetical protein Z520_02830 [Fonsecaea multimorphosa CBS 102226]